jgi:hypothetical protein
MVFLLLQKSAWEIYIPSLSRIFMKSTAKYNVIVLYHLSQPMPVHSLQIIYNALTFTQLHVSIFIMHIQQTATVHFYICLLKFVDRLILPRLYFWTKHISLFDWFLCYLIILFQLHKFYSNDLGGKTRMNDK